MNVPTQAPAPAKKGMSPLAWIGIGCGVIIVIGVIVLGAVGYWAKKKLENPTMAAAELVVRANPDLELVSSDPKTNTMTIKNKKTGETVTWNAEDIKNGRVSVEVTDAKGQKQEATFGGGAGGPQNLPSWVPSYPGGQVQGNYDTTGPQGRNAAFVVSTSDATGKVIDWYESELKAQGFTVEKNTYNVNGQNGGTLNGKVADEKRSVHVNVSASEGKTLATVMFEEKK